MNSFNKTKALVLSIVLSTMAVAIPISNLNDTNSIVSIVNAEENSITMDDLPQDYKESMDWIWQNRILDEKSTERRNLIFDQIVAGKGTLNYVVRWQSYQTLTYEQRQKMETMLYNQINAWTKWLVDFEGWPYKEVKVNIVGWAVINDSIILDKHDDEIVYTTCSTDSLHNDHSEIPAELPYAPTELSRADHFADSSYVYPENSFDMYLWGTTGFNGGAGGDWGQRISDSYILSVLDQQDAHIIEHEIGHGFGMTDFYEESKCPTWPEGSTNIMVAGWANKVTDYDGWMLRYIWDKIKDEDGRFDLSTIPEETTTTSETTTETTSETIETTEDTTTNTDTNNKTWTFDANNSTSMEISISGNPYAGVSGEYTCLDADGNTLLTNSWVMSNSLGENGNDTFNIELPTNCDKVVLTVDTYFAWNNSLNDFEDLNPDTLNITANTIPEETSTTEPTTTEASTTEPTTTEDSTTEPTTTETSTTEPTTTEASTTEPTTTEASTTEPTTTETSTTEPTTTEASTTEPTTTETSNTEPTTTESSTIEPNLLLGDVNGDGQIKTGDLLLMKKYLLGLCNETDIVKLNSDLNGDGEVKTTDLLILKKYFLGLVEL